MNLAVLLGCPHIPMAGWGGGGIRMWEEGGRIPLRNQEGLGWVEGPLLWE